MQELYQRAIQTYLRDARRSFNVKVFKAKVYYSGQEEPEIHYFTNRIEVGCMQQQERLKLLHEYLENTQKDQFVNNLEQQRNLGLLGQIKENESFSATVECRVAD